MSLITAQHVSAPHSTFNYVAGHQTNITNNHYVIHQGDDIVLSKTAAKRFGQIASFKIRYCTHRTLDGILQKLAYLEHGKR